MNPNEIAEQRALHAKAVAEAGGVGNAIEQGVLPQYIDTTVAEAVILGLLRQNVRKFIVVLGHGSTEIGEVLRIYEENGLVKSYAVRNEVAASHAATALRWVTGEKAAVVTSIGPGAMHALAGSLAPASDGLGVWYLFGDETMEDEGPNMQQIPKYEQHSFLKLCSAMGDAYTLQTPEAVGAALRRGLCRVDDPHFAGPFYLLLPLNTQPAELPGFNIDELPVGAPPALGAASDDSAYKKAADAIEKAKRIVVKVGAGASGASTQLAQFVDLVDGVVVMSPRLTGALPYANPRNMTVGGSKGSICGNFAMEEADLLVAVGTRAVCQSDSSRTGYPKVERVININTDAKAALHYNRTIALVGDAAATLDKLMAALRDKSVAPPSEPSAWMRQCSEKRKEWDAFKKERYDNPILRDEMWGCDVLTQPAVIKIATDWAGQIGAKTFFDAGDVQANGFQVVEDERVGRTFNETGASYMGFAASSLLATALADEKFYGLAITGDGSFMMNPQILIDGVQHGAFGCILLLDNRRMAAISSLQNAQYGKEYATNDGVQVDYSAMARAFRGVFSIHAGFSPETLQSALDKAYKRQGLSLIHVPVYYGADPLGGLGAYGRWNVGNWVRDTQKLRHKIGL